MAAPSSKVADALARIEASPGDKAPLYEALLADVTPFASSAGAIADLNALVDSFLAQGLGIVSTRAVLTAFIATLKAVNDTDVWIKVGEQALRSLASQLVSFQDATSVLCELIASGYEAREEFAEAARVLATIALDSSQRKVTDEKKARIWIRIVRNYLEVEESTSAEMYMNKLRNIMHTVPEPSLNLHFRLSHARILDAKRDFLAAAQRYHEISLAPAISEEERLHTLSIAIKCAILAPAGPMRGRALGRLHRDERSVQLEEFGILEKIFLDQLLSQEEVDKFAKGLQPHQLAKTSDGSTVLAKAVVEHNLLGVSRLYSNIHFDALGSLLGLDAVRAEETTARMIEQGRLVGRIDQLTGIIWFDGGELSKEKGSIAAESLYGKQLRQWDANVESLSEEVERITDTLQKEYPDFVAKHLVV